MRALPVEIPYAWSRSPGVLLFGDAPERRRRLADLIAEAGGRVVESAPLTDASDRLDGSAARVVIDLGAGDGDAVDTILDRLTAVGAAALLLIPEALIDRVVARIDDAGIDILVDADPREWSAAVSALVAACADGVAEDGEADNRRRLAALSEEVGRIARALAALSVESPVPSPDMAASEGSSLSAADLPLVRAIVRLGRLRGLHFEPALFADPAWDILLDLAAARIEGRTVAVSSLCIAAGVPATTALRWITQMTAQGLLVRRPDAQDGRRVFIALGDGAATAMEGYLAGAQRIVTPVA